jgi:hypothetical protein
MQSADEWLKSITAHGETIFWVIGTCFVFILGKIVGQRTRIIYKQPTQEGYVDFKEYGSKTYTQDGPIGADGEGQTRVLPKGIIEISRANTEGRWILQFQNFRSDDGQDRSYIQARPEAGSQRSFDVSLEARAIGGPQTLRVAFRAAAPKQEFIQAVLISVEPDKWQKVGRLMVSSADKDMYFFLESSAQKATGKVHVRKLVLREKFPGLRFDWLIRLLNRLLGRERDQAE